MDLATFSISNAEEWEGYVGENRDGYGFAIIRYAAHWACLMEKRMEEGADLEHIAKETSYEADTEGMTPFMYGAAVKTLVDVWEHGEQLRRWHNLNTQLGDEGERANEQGGTINPALLYKRQ